MKRGSDFLRKYSNEDNFITGLKKVNLYSIILEWIQIFFLLVNMITKNLI